MPTRLSSIQYQNPSQPLSIDSNNKPLLIVPVFQDKTNDPKNPTFQTSAELTYAEKQVGFPIAKTFKLEEFTGGYGSSLYVSNSAMPVSVLFVGFGDQQKKNQLPVYRIHKAYSKALSTVKRKELTSLIAIISTDGTNKLQDVLSLQLICAVGDHFYETREVKEPSEHKANLTLITNEAAGKSATAEFGLATVKARALAMDLVNMPANIKTTASLVDAANSLKDLGLTVTIQNDVEWIKSNMPCFYEVGRGSVITDPPRWIRVHYKPAGSIKQKIALVGKSVIFDTGGYQVKPDPYMNTMKADMTGGATVLSVIQAVATLKIPNVEVTAYLAATPNKIDSDAMLPDSIVNTSSGKKVEIRHTDAEGRLTLIDAVNQAEKDSPDLIFTIATLTGSAARAVGPRTALMSNNNEWRDKFAKIAEQYGDSCQKLDILEEDFEDIKSKLDGADINNTGHEKYRGAQTAASFILSGLADENKPLIHLDVAGGDMTTDEKATAIAVRGLLGFIHEQ